MAEDMIGHGLGRDVSAANANGHDEFDLVVQVGGLRRVGQVRPLRTACVENGVGPLGEEERRLAHRIGPHLAGMIGIVAPHAENPPDRKTGRAAHDSQAGCGRKRRDRHFSHGRFVRHGACAFKRVCG